MVKRVSTVDTQSTPPKNPSGTIRFFPEQLEYLRSLFPQRVLPPSATVEELRDYFGEQKVMRAIEIRTRR